MGESVISRRDLLAHDHVMQLLNALLQRPNILVELRELYDKRPTKGGKAMPLSKLVGMLHSDAIASGFQYADTFIAAADPVRTPTNRRAPPLSHGFLHAKAFIDGVAARNARATGAPERGTAGRCRAAKAAKADRPRPASRKPAKRGKAPSRGRKGKRGSKS